MFLKNKNIIFKIRRSKVTDYAALKTKTLKIYVLLAFKLSYDGSILLVNVEMPTIVGILKFMSRINFVLS